jgi:hypothetical protein
MNTGGREYVFGEDVAFECSTIFCQRSQLQITNFRIHIFGQSIGEITYEIIYVCISSSFFKMEQCTLRDVNKYLNTNIYSNLETSGG